MMKNTHPMIRSLLRAVLLCAASSAGLVLLPSKDVQGMMSALRPGPAALQGAAQQPERAEPAPAPAAPARGYLGVIVAHESADVAAQMAGRLTSLRVGLGDEVKRGALIATLDARALRGDNAVVAASLQQAEVEQKKAAIDLEQAQARLTRIRPLSEGIPAISGEELEKATFQERSAAARVEAQQALLKERHALLRRTRASYAEAQILAPFDGVITARYVDRGGRVGQGTPIVRIISRGPLRVRFVLPEQDTAALAVGTAVRVRVPELAADLPAVVERVAPELDAASRMIVVEGALQVPAQRQGQTLVGRTARVFLVKPAAPATPNPRSEDGHAS